MPKNSFVMRSQKQGRMKYLLLTMVPPIALMYLVSKLLDCCIKLNSVVVDIVLIFLPMTFMMILGYFLIFRKNHQVEVKDNQIIETNWRQHEICRFKVSQIHSVKRNFLNEIIIVDKNGNRILCVESNMSNFQQFEHWLQEHNIELRRN